MKALDLSNFTAPLTDQMLIDWKAAGVGHVIIQAIDPPPAYPVGKTRDQLIACHAAGLTTDVYVYLWTKSDVESDMLAKLSLLDGLEDQVRKVWLDAEDTTAATVDARLSAIRRALAILDAWGTVHDKPPAGIYTGKWWWQAYLGNTTEFADRHLWAAQYDAVADASMFDPLGGWQDCRIKQYAGSQPDGTDLNILSAAEESDVLGQSPGEPPTPSPPIDQGWLDKKDLVVGLAGELLSVADQLTAEANRKGGPRVKEIRRLATEVRSRTEKILA